MKEAADKVLGGLMAKTRRPKRWFPEVEQELYKMFQVRRKRKVRVSRRWATIAFKKLLTEMHPDDPQATALWPSFQFGRKRASNHSLSKRKNSNSRTSLWKSACQPSGYSARGRQLMQESAVWGTDSPRVGVAGPNTHPRTTVGGTAAAAFPRPQVGALPAEQEVEQGPSAVGVREQ